MNICVFCSKAIVTRSQHKQMLQGGFTSAFQILITREISLEKILIVAPKKTIPRRLTIDVVSKIDESMNNGNLLEDIVPHKSFVHASNSMETGEPESNDLDTNMASVGNDNNNSGHPSVEGSEANADRTYHQRSMDAMTLWKKWSFRSSNIPFGVRGRRRSMFIEKRLTLSPTKGGDVNEN